jgi:beta-N-acetylhexosaminidase
MKNNRIFFLTAVLMLCFCAAYAQESRFTKPRARGVNGARYVIVEHPEGSKIDRETLDALPVQHGTGEMSFDRLTLSEKLAQTIVISADVDTAYKYKKAIEEGLVGGVLIQWGDYSLEQTQNFVRRLQRWAAKSPSKIPLLISIDYEGGTVYTPVTLGFPYLPTNMMLAAAGNIEDTITLFYIVATTLKSVGVHINFAPVIDVNVNPANPIIGVRSFGSDTDVVGQMGLALIKGLQAAGIMAVAKHFPGHGETVIDSHLDLPRLNMTREQFERVHLPPFKLAVDNGVMGVMTAHIVYDFIDKENPATFSPQILKGLLRGNMGFEGVVISDSLDMGGALKGRNLIGACIKALSSGVDMILTSKRDPKLTHAQTLAEIDKTIPRENIETAAKKIFELKRSLGLFEDGQVYASDIKQSVETFNFFADKITRGAVTLVRGEEGTLPYTKYSAAAPDGEKKPKLCSVFFSPSRFADQLPVINTPFMEKGWQVDYYNARMRPGENDIRRAKQCMMNADLVILGSLQWADKPIVAQRAAVRELLKEDKDIILLSLMSPYDIKFYPEAKNIIALYGVNKLSSRAAADIILGNIEPRGRLPIKL